MSGLLARLVILVALWAIPVLAGDARAQQTAKTPGVDVAYEEGLLSLEADGAALSQVLGAIAAEARFDLFLDGDLSRPVSESLSQVPLDQALRLLIDSTTSVFLHDDEGAITGVIVDGEGSGQKRTIAHRSSSFMLDRFGLELVAEQDAEIRADLAELDAPERAEAMAWLVDQGGEEMVGTLGYFLALDRDPVVRQEAASALRRIGGESATRALETGLGDKDSDVRFQTVESLGAMSSERATLALGTVLFGESDPQVRASAVAALGQTRTEAARAFIQAAADDSDERVRTLAGDLLAAWN
ncbi:MAG: HEAT repeat domain-containing protein [Pseudomonadota bacterium]